MRIQKLWSKNIQKRFENRYMKKSWRNVYKRNWDTTIHIKDIKKQMQAKMKL